MYYSEFLASITKFENSFWKRVGVRNIFKCCSKYIKYFTYSRYICYTVYIPNQVNNRMNQNSELILKDWPHIIMRGRALYFTLALICYFTSVVLSRFFILTLNKREKNILTGLLAQYSFGQSPNNSVRG